MNVVGLIPARGGSKRVPGKNIKQLAGKPLIAYTIEAALKAKQIKRVIVSTDSEEIKDVSLEYGAEVPFMRPGDLAGDNVSDLPVMRHALDFLKGEDYEPDAIAYLRPTTPFKTSEIIDETVIRFYKSKADVVRTLAPVEGVSHPYWMFKQDDNGKIKPFIEGIRISEYYQSQLLPPAFRISGVVDIFSVSAIVNSDIYDNQNMFSVIVPVGMSVDIDTELDFRLCELIMLSQFEENNE